MSQVGSVGRVSALLLSILLTALATDVSAQSRAWALSSQPNTGRRLALVIGNDSYPGARLQNARNDAKAIGTALVKYGFTVDVALDTTYRDLSTRVDRFVAQLRPGDTAFVFYSGHGMQIEGDNYLIPVDFNSRDEAGAKYESYSAGRIVDRVVGQGARLTVLVLDACRTNPYRVTRAAGGGWASMNSGMGTLIAFATAPGTTASDNPDGANGLFTTFLLDAIDQPGLGIGQVFDRVRLKLYEASKGLQLSYTTSSVLGEFYFRPPAGAAPANASGPAPSATPSPATSAVPSASSAPPTALRTENWNRCRSEDHEIRIVGCTALIQMSQDGPADMAVAYLNRGSSFVAKARLDAALQDFDKAIQLDQTSAPAFYKRAWINDEKGEYAKSIADLDQAIRLEPGTADFFDERGYAHRRLRQFDRAIQDYDRAIALAPGSADKFNDRGLAYRDKGDQARAIQDYTEAIRLNPASADALTNRAVAYIVQRRYDRALQDLNAAVKQAPKSAWALYARGVVRRLQGDSTGGEADMAAARQVQANIAEVLAGVGVGSPAAAPAAGASAASTQPAATLTRDDAWKTCRGSDPKASFAACSALIQAGSETGSNLAIAYASRAYFSGEDNDRVIQDLTEAIRLSPDVNYYSNRGLAYQRKNDEDHALADYSQAIAMNPKQASGAAYFNRAAIYMKRGENEPAIKDLAAYIDRERKDESAFLWRAIAYYRTGDYGRSISDYSKAIDLRRDWALAFWGRGLAKQRKGDNKGGLSDMAKGAQLVANVADIMAQELGVKP